MISRYVRWESVAFWKASKFFFRATISWVFLSIALKSTPYAPFPEIFKKNKVRSDSFNIKKMIINTNYIQREINEKFQEMKVKKIVSNSVNKKSNQK